MFSFPGPARNLVWAEEDPGPQSRGFGRPPTPIQTAPQVRDKGPPRAGTRPGQGRTPPTPKTRPLP